MSEKNDANFFDNFAAKNFFCDDSVASGEDVQISDQKNQGCQMAY
jgi:hypothetical protein